MKTGLHTHRRAGFTLVELLIGSTIGVIVSVGVFAFINTGSMLTARNLSVNLTSNSMRGSLDQVETLIQQSDTMPTLINTSATTVAGTGPAAGVRFDLFAGGPVVVNPGNLTLASSTTSFTIRYAQASSRAPAAGDIVRFDGTTSTLRPRISAVTSNTSVSAGMRDATVTLTSSLGTAVSATTALRARIVRDVALIVMPGGAGRQLRYYTDMAGTADLTDATKYKVVSDQIALEAADATPFSTTTIASREFVSLSLRLRASSFDQRMLGKQADQFNTFAQVNSFIRPKTNP
jgi:prepilin-type N-terminal cleavage/methylation domain-containing protein